MFLQISFFLTQSKILWHFSDYEDFFRPLFDFWQSYTIDRARGVSIALFCTLSTSMFSTSLSRDGIQLGAKWQFWKKTHFPRSIAERIIASARGP